MFSILIMIGITLLAVGTYRNRNRTENTTSKPTELEEFLELKSRVDIIESILFYDVGALIQEDEKIENYSTLGSINDSITYENIAKSVDAPTQDYKTSTSTSKKYRMLCQYEEENYTIEEISVLLNMNKGEILLLKSLYKNSNQ